MLRGLVDRRSFSGICGRSSTIRWRGRQRHGNWPSSYPCRRCGSHELNRKRNVASTWARSAALTQLQLGQKYAGNVEDPPVRVIEETRPYRRERISMPSEINRSIHRKCCLGQECVYPLLSKIVGSSSRVSDAVEIHIENYLGMAIGLPQIVVQAFMRLILAVPLNGRTVNTMPASRICLLSSTSCTSSHRLAARHSQVPCVWFHLPPVQPLRQPSRRYP